MENRKLTNPISEELNEEDLSVVSGGNGNSMPVSNPIPNLSRGMSDMIRCYRCGELKPFGGQSQNRLFCRECWSLGKAAAHD